MITKFNDEPIWFYLDAHYFRYPEKQHLIATTNHMPLMDELKAIQIRKNPKDLIIIDDFRWLKKPLNVERNTSYLDVLQLMQPSKHIVIKELLVFPNQSVSIL